MANTPHTEAIARAAKIKLMIFDIDGVLTDGSMQYGLDGECMKPFYVHDGLGIQILQRAGIATAIISARQTSIVTRRAADLGIQHVFQGSHDKRQAFQQLCEHTGVAPEACGFIGDDVIDLPILLRVGFAAGVPAAHAEVLSRVHYVTQAQGGRGAAREICDFILRAQDKYEAALAPYLA